jgi:hypothetical protein
MSDSTSSPSAEQKSGAKIVHRPFGPHCVFQCPNGRGMCSAEVQPTADAPWTNHGSDERPTLTPSFNCVGGCGWHGYVVDGQLQSAPPGMSSLMICGECKSPHPISVNLSRDVEGRLIVQLGTSRFAARSSEEAR